MQLLYLERGLVDGEEWPKLFLPQQERLGPGHLSRRFKPEKTLVEVYGNTYWLWAGIAHILKRVYQHSTPPLNHCRRGDGGVYKRMNAK